MSFADAVLSSYAPDGGLFVPTTLPRFTFDELSALVGKPFPFIVAEVLFRFASDDIDLRTLHRLAESAYGRANFHADPALPLVDLDGSKLVLETFHGPTAAFKDIGLQMVGRLLAHFLNERGRTANVLTETSGDTGPAALAACAGVPGVEIFCLYPKGRVSRIQELQLTTAESDAENIHVFQTEGNTDEQALVLKVCAGSSDHRDHRTHSLPPSPYHCLPLDKN